MELQTPFHRQSKLPFLADGAAKHRQGCPVEAVPTGRGATLFAYGAWACGGQCNITPEQNTIGISAADACPAKAAICFTPRTGDTCAYWNEKLALNGNLGKMLGRVEKR